MQVTRQLIIARVNPLARGSLAAGMAAAQIESALWMGDDDGRELGLATGDCVLIRAEYSSSRPTGAAMALTATVALVDENVLAPGCVMMAAGPRSARLLPAETECSGTPTCKGAIVSIERAPAATVREKPPEPSTAHPTDAPATGAPSPPRQIADAVCTACGCICDDIELHVDGAAIAEARNACEIGRDWFLSADHTDDGSPADAVSCRIDGQPATLEEGLRRAAEILLSARNPLVYGLSHASCESQRIAVEIADLLRANIDTTTSTFHGPTVLGLQAVGESTCTLGEIRDRADLVMLWGVNPLETDPRHYSRYSLLPAGRFVPRGRADRYCVVVDVRHTPTADVADLALRIKPAGDFEALWTLRALARGEALDGVAVEAATGVALSQWRALFERMRQARYGVILYGTGVTQTRGKHLNCEALLSLVTDMNRYTRFACKAMRGAGNVTGADNVLTWRTGYPFGVNFARGYPRYNPGEYTAADLLARREVDALLLAASDPAPLFGPAALDHVRAIPTVVVDAHPERTWPTATVSLRTSRYGLHTGGTVYRMDEIPLSLRPALDCPLPSDLQILEALADAIRSRVNTAEQVERAADTHVNAERGGR